MQTTGIKSKKTKQITRKVKKGYKKKGNDTKNKLLPQDDGGREADEETFRATKSSTTASNTVVKVIGKFQIFCQVTIHMMSGYPEN